MSDNTQSEAGNGILKNAHCIAMAIISQVQERCDKIVGMNFIERDRIEFELIDGKRTGGHFDIIPQLLGKTVEEQQTGIDAISTSIIEHAENLSRHYRQFAQQTQILPVIRTRDDVEKFDKAGNVDMIGSGLARHLIGDLFVMLVEDSEESANIVLHFDSQKQNADALHELAIKNLETVTEQKGLDTNASLAPFTKLSLDGYYDTSLILLPSFWEFHLAYHYDGYIPLCVCAARNGLWFLHDNGQPDELSSQLTAFAKGAQKYAEYPISSTVLTRNEQGAFVVVEPLEI
ncbi:MAG: hypothetical protein AB8B94_06555 [Hyphomicrobiales bacterium]